MSDHKKIDWLRWHKRKYFIRINCFIMVCILLIVLLLQFPIVHAEEPTVGDYWHMEDILNYEDALSHNGESGYYNVNANIFTAPTFYGSKGDVINFYDKLRAVFELPISSFGNGFATNYNMTICKQQNSDNLLIIFQGNSISLNYQGGTYSYVRPPSIYGGSPVYYIFDGSNVSYGGYYDGGSYHDISNCDYILFTSMDVNMYYQNADRNLNYLKIDGKMGIGSGGFGVPSPDNSVQEHKRVYEGSCVYMQFSNLNTGNLHIVCKTDDFQKSNNYYVKLRVTNSTSVHRNALYTYKRSGSSGDFLNNFDVPNNTFNRGEYTEYDIPLSAFSNSGDYTIDLSTLNNGLLDSNERSLLSFASNFENSSTGLQSAMESMVFSLLSVINYKFYDANASSYNVALDSFVYDVSVALCGGSGNNASEEIFDSFTLDMVSGALTQQDYPQSTEDDVKEQLNTTIIPSNYVPKPQNPSYPDAYNVTVPNTPSNNNDNNDTNNNNVAPTNNNNVTNGDYSPSVVNNNNVTIEQGNKYPEKGVMTSFIRIINNDKNNAVNDVNTLVAGNDFINLCNNTLYAVPNQYWNVWLTAFKAILGIGISAFFLKILYNWAT